MTVMIRFAIFAAMKRALLLIALMVVGAPLFAQSTEFGVIVGGSRRFVDIGQKDTGVVWIDSKFNFTNSSVELFWGMAIDEESWFKLKVGRIETQIAEEYSVPGTPGRFRRDAE